MKFVEEGIILLNQKKIRVASSIKRGFKEGFPDGTTFIENVLWVNSSPMDVSLCGSEILKLGYDIAVMFYIDKEKVIYSLRSKKFDVSILSEQFGGGGHKEAAGFNIPLNKFYSIKGNAL